MEVALARLVGAGLTLVFEGFEEPAPPGAVANGLRFVGHIARARPDVITGLTEGVVKDIWREWRQAKLPQDVAELHIEALPELMDKCRPSDGMMLGAVAAIQVARRIGSVARPVSHSSRIAAAVVGRAIETGFLTSRGLNESIAFFFLERLLARLMPDQQLFFELRPVFQDYVARGAWQPTSDDAQPPAKQQAEPATGSAQDSGQPGEASTGTEPVAVAVAATEDAHGGISGTAQPIGATSEPQPAQSSSATTASSPLARLAADAGVPERALELLEKRAAARLGRVADSLLEDFAHGLSAMLAALAAPSDSQTAAADYKQQAGSQLADGNFDGADQLLGQAEDIYLRGAQQDLASAHGQLGAAAAIRSMRAQLAELTGDFRRAARHYGVATRCLPESDRRNRRGYMVRQAGALVAQGEIAAETSALSEAALVYADAGRLLSEQEDPLGWATANLELGRILMELGEREGKAERFLAAALHFKPAADVFSRLKQSDGWARAQLGIGDALRAQGEVQGDIFTLSEAAFAYRAALGVATRDRMPAEWAAASCRLARTLLRLDREGRQLSHHDEAMQHLRGVLTPGDATWPSVPALLRCEAAVQLATALVDLAEARGETWLGDEALSLAQRDYAPSARHVAASLRAELDDVLGSTLRRLGRSRADMALLTEAAELKLAALDSRQAGGHREAQDRLRQEIAEIEQDVANLRTASAAGAAA